MRKQLIGSLFAFAMAGQLWGQGLYEKYERMLTLPEGYVCYRVDGKIKVDGKLNEADWQKAQSTSSFVDISGEGFAKPCYDTSAKMLWDDNYLYVGAVFFKKRISRHVLPSVIPSSIMTMTLKFSWIRMETGRITLK